MIFLVLKNGYDQAISIFLPLGVDVSRYDAGAAAAILWQWGVV